VNINIQFDSSAQSAPAGYQQAVLAAASLFDALLTDNITINIQVGFGQFPGPLPDQSSALGGPWNGDLNSYSKIRNLLISGASSGDTIFNTLPAGSDVPGSGNIWLFAAEEKAVGLRAANDPASVGGFAIGTSVPSTLWISM
jgi:hypothetical protein